MLFIRNSHRCFNFSGFCALGDGKTSQAEARGITNQIRCPFTEQDVAAAQKPILDQVSARNVTASLGRAVGLCIGKAATIPSQGYKETLENTSTHL